MPELRRPLSVVRVIIENLEGKVLFLRRSGASYGEGSYCLPGGKVDWGQTVEGAARHEVKTETSLDMGKMKFLFYDDSLPEDEEDMHVINFYFHAVHDGKSEVRINEESSRGVWISPQEMSGYDIVFGNDIAVRKYFDSR